MEASAGISKIPIWIDCDPGPDDAYAILLAAYHPRLELVGISTTYGNGSLHQTTKNALGILELIGKRNVPVVAGARDPFCRQAFATDSDGISMGRLLPSPTCTALELSAIEAMRQAILKYPKDTFWLVAIGPLTNAALLFATYPELASHIKGLSIMSGSIGDFGPVSLGQHRDVSGKLFPRCGNRTPFAEFNILCDPESAQSVLQNPELRRKITLVPPDLTHQVCASAQIQDRLFGSDSNSSELRLIYHELLLFYTGGYPNGPPLHDPLAVAVLLSAYPDEEVRIRFSDRDDERWDVTVTLEGEQLGRTIVESRRDRVRIPRTVQI